MKRFRLPLAWLLAALVSCAATAQEPAIPPWFDAAASPEANAAKAKDASVAPALATGTLIQYGGEAPASAAAVVKVYDTCDAVYESVEEGVRRSPNEVDAIIAAVLESERCPCSSDAVWARSRLQKRLRLEVRTGMVETPGVCLCTAAVAEAAARAVPGRAQQVFDVVLRDPRRCNCATAAFAAIVNGLGPEAKPWIESQQQLLRVEKDADGRVVDMVSEPMPVEGQPSQKWLDRGSVTTRPGEEECRAPVLTVGAPEADAPQRCDDYARPEVAITRYRGTAGERRAVEIANRTDVDVDLAAAGLALDIYVSGEERAEERVDLAGTLPAQGTFLVSTPEPPVGFVKDDIDQEADELGLPGIDAVVLRQMRNERYCRVQLGDIALEFPDSPIPIAAPQPEIVGEPRTDESTIDPNRGGDLASPN